MATVLRERAAWLFAEADNIERTPRATRHAVKRLVLVERFANSHKVISAACSEETGVVARTGRYRAG
jgi:hypothetical protein